MQQRAVRFWHALAAQPASGEARTSQRDVLYDYD